MAANTDTDTDMDDATVSEEELKAALCVLAGSDPENCSYSRGYVKRQAVFACNTCTPGTSEPAGLCLACANKCHDGHDIFELYTKRNFRCDCGNSKFGDFQCRLVPAKDEQNVRNHYDHNFNGRYCTCDRPYPDTDDQVNDEMIQCVICEDWFHGRHLGCTVAETEELQEMVCEGCMNKAPFLWTYAAHFAEPPAITVSDAEGEDVEFEEGAETEGESDAEVDVEEGAETEDKSDADVEEGAEMEDKSDAEVDVEEGAEMEEESEPSQSSDEEPSTSAANAKQEETENKSSPCKRTYDEMTGSPAKATTKTVACRLKELQAQEPERPRQGAVFWPYSWRSELCTCTSCKKAYVAAEVQFLMDQSDTVLAYENRGLEEPFGLHPLMALTRSLNHIQQLEFIYGVKELATSISAFLDQFAAEGKPVTVAAIHEFFEDLLARWKQRNRARYE